MPVYRCRIGTEDQRIVERNLRAPDRGALTAAVEARGQVLLEARREFRLGDGGVPDPDEIALAFSQLAALLRGGVGLGEALAAVTSRPTRRARPSLRILRTRHPR